MKKFMLIISLFLCLVTSRASINLGKDSIIKISKTLTISPDKFTKHLDDYADDRNVSGLMNFLSSRVILVEYSDTANATFKNKVQMELFLLRFINTYRPFDYDIYYSDNYMTQMLIIDSKSPELEEIMLICFYFGKDGLVDMVVTQQPITVRR